MQLETSGKMKIYSVIPIFLLLVPEGLANMPKIVSSPENVTVTSGRNAILSCTVDDLGPYNVAWMKVDTQTILTVQTKVITHDSRLRVTHNNYQTWFLHIKNVNFGDTGYYMCQINTVPMTSNNAFLHVFVPPSIIQNENSDDIIVKEFNSVSLHCEANGHPKPIITWQREDDRRIFTAWNRYNLHSEETIEGEYLNLTRVTRDHMGAYLCVAFNGVPPPVSKRIVLKVHFSPRLKVKDQLVGAPIKSEISLHCQVEGYPLPMTSWRKYDKLILSNNKHQTSVVEKDYKLFMTLKIKSLEEQDYGAYKCCATNTLGKREGLIRLYKTLADSFDTSQVITETLTELAYTPKAYIGNFNSSVASSCILSSKKILLVVMLCCAINFAQF